MAKRLTFDALPAAVEKILDILTAEGSEHTALPELAMRMTLLEKKLDYLQKTVSPDRPMMDTRAVCRVLKLRPKAVSELAASGVLPSRAEGRRTLFYEDAVVRYFMTQPAWKEAAASKPAAAKRFSSEPASDATVFGGPGPAPDAVETRQRIGIDAAGEILDRSAAAVYQLIQAKNIPYYKDGRKVYFYSDELREWVKTHPARKRKPKNR